MRDQRWCASAGVFRIQEGNSDGVDLGGRTLAYSWYFPGPFLDGNGTGRLYLDEAASEQRKELEVIFQGKKGGPLELFAVLIPRWLATLNTKIELLEEGDTITATIAGGGQIESQRLKDRAGRPTILQNAGLASALQIDTMALAPSTGTRWADPDLPRQFESKSGIVADVYWRVR